MKTIRLTRNKCIGCGYCADVAPTLFYMDTFDAKANLYNSVIKDNYTETPLCEKEDAIIKKIIIACPVRIISLYLHNTKIN